MIFPLYDDNTGRRTTPVVTYLFIAINILVFIFLQGGGSNEKFTYAYSTVPYEIVNNEDVTRRVTIVDPLTDKPIGVIQHQPIAGSVYLTLLTSMFMHGGWMHLLGNMLFLFIFGDNVEDDLGKVRYFIFYLVCGFIASMAHVLTNTSGVSALIPSLGASGAISGVLGAYLVMHPRRRVTVLMLRMLTQVPGWVAVGLWFVFQLINGLGFLGGGSQEGGGVAYAAHVGGFIAGLVLVKLFAIGRTRGGDGQTANAF